MLTQAKDFHDESAALYALLAPLSAADFTIPTQFKNWTLNDILEHLHMWNWAAHESLVNEEGFVAFLEDIQSHIDGGLKAYERKWIGDLSGRALLDKWYAFFTQMTPQWEAADPKQRLKWAGPDMSVRSSMTARLMETWAHGQAAYDALGVERQNTDRIQNIVVLGINTYGWTYAVRRETLPIPQPFVSLTAPSGAIWEYGTPSDDERIEGMAEAFCQVVTQVRNVADVSLKLVGANAHDWMSKAQCFAGPPEVPPPPHTRFRRS